MSKILVNAAKCKKCGDIIESMIRHHFVTCSCGFVSVDGGHSYLKRAFKGSGHFVPGQSDKEIEDYFIEMSVYEEDEEKKKVEPIDAIIEAVGLTEQLGGLVKKQEDLSRYAKSWGLGK